MLHSPDPVHAMICVLLVKLSLKFVPNGNGEWSLQLGRWIHLGSLFHSHWGMKLNVSKFMTLILYRPLKMHLQSTLWTTCGTAERAWRPSYVWSDNWCQDDLWETSSLSFSNGILKRSWRLGNIDHSCWDDFWILSCQCWSTVQLCAARLPIHTFGTGPCRR